jgi:hypothetical protein
MVNGAELSEGADYSVDYAAGSIAFVAPPGEPAVAGQDNVTVTFLRTVAGYAGRIVGCRISASFGAGANDRVFLSGTPAYPNLDWRSQPQDPSFFADTGYAVIGGGQSGRHGLPAHRGDARAPQIALRRRRDLYLRSASLDGVSGVVFPLRARGQRRGGGVASRGAQPAGRSLFLAPRGCSPWPRGR